MLDSRLQYLLEKFHAGTCTPEEKAELENWYKQLSATNQPFVEEDSEAAEQFKEVMLKEFRQRVPAKRKIWVYRMVAAAAVLVIVSVAIFYFTRSPQENDIVIKPVTNQDILPGGNHATLTLADGSNILLDTAKQGGLAQQGISAIHKPADGLLVYEPTETTAQNESGMNRVSTPRGGQYQVRLPDGTKVWLNASSSIAFPVSFTNDTRKVQITGEVYFEVAHMPKLPFIVQVAGKGEVEVLGTHFNINAYEDEAAIKTTLLEGSVNVRNKLNQSKILTPGQQAQINNDRLTVINEADIEEAVAWKNGLFKFNDADIQSILRQAARWYDIEVEMRGTSSGERFRGKISRDVKLSEFLRILEVNQVSFQIEGKKIIIQH